MRAVVIVIACVLASCARETEPDELRFVDASLPDGSPWGLFDATPNPRRDAGPRPPSSALSWGEDELVQLFVGDAGYLVVRRDVVQRFDRDGVERARWDAPERVVTAAFDGAQLTVVDGTSVVALDADALVEQMRTPLARRCSSATMLSGARLVCRDRDEASTHGLTVYDVVSGVELGHAITSDQRSVLHLFAVPDDAAVIALPDVAWASWVQPRLYRVEDGVASEWGIADAHDSESAAPFLAIVRGAPARVVNERGHVFRFDTCAEGTAPCFERDGSLGTIGVRESVVAMDDLDHDAVLTLSQRQGSTGPRCVGGCALRRTDLATRAVLAEGTFEGPVGGVIAVRWDPRGGAAFVAGSTSCSDVACRGWSVTRVVMEDAR
ncbi:hypothetical protein [Sandaracinus amylolyticus]|uniref:hypothetical protein n=1 Tax=Sandaracinus amylolyticus TaxID=927083 RepID=UPI001F3B1094|nr:hypothetical protein [Sandaracinus amylolyticus]UJR80698.1 Hypothetical protein I5071_27470 [Sandaracinus amylolyticus]